MPLLNYTTQVNAEKTASEVQRMLARAGARAIMAEYDDGHIKGVAFQIQTSFGLQQFHLPVNVEACLAVLKRDSDRWKKTPGPVIPKKYATFEQAERVAWRIMKDWLEAQLAIIATEMVTFDQVMLPYMYQNGKTVYELVIDQQLALNPAEATG